ncbi:hypothetical protein PC114_g8673 [Phytophthora cactorum]|nr:hypothetical protein PC114_g8673 [Phytophthora cactorum]
MVQDVAFTGYEEETQPFMLGWDLDQSGNPVVGNGSDEKPFLVGILEGMYTKDLAALRRVFEAVTNKLLRVYYVMGDADDGQFNSVKNVFGRDNQYVYLMCFFHVMKIVNDTLKFVDERAANRVRKDIYDLHFAENRSDFVRLCYSILSRWRSDPSTAAFAIYFKKVRLTGKFIRW